MLIPISDATTRYGLSRRTLNRRINDGALTRHTRPDSGVVLLDTEELDQLAQAESGDGSERPAPLRDEAGVEPIGIAERFLIDPDALDEAVRRAMRPVRFPRLRR